MKARLGLAALAACCITPALAYSIRPKHNVHEAMTVLAERCQQSASDPAAIDCRASYPELAALRSVASGPAYQSLHISTHWPDDPTRMVTTGPPAIRFAAEAGLLCKRRRDETERAGRAYTLAVSGMLCASHAGELQFLHAMASSPTDRESAEETRQKALDWAVFAYSVATGRIAADADYCTAVRAHAGAAAASLAPADLPQCAGRGSRLPAWTVASFFTRQCRGLLRDAASLDCPAAPGDPAALARQNASGAVLHVIQDSYSQSHAVRGPAYGSGDAARPTAVVSCTLPTAFYFYNEQDGGNHGKADERPRLDANCRPGAEADDAITASAVALWHIRNRSDPRAFGCYLERRVLGRARVSYCG